MNWADKHTLSLTLGGARSSEEFDLTVCSDFLFVVVVVGLHVAAQRAQTRTQLSHT